ncbi:MAG: CoA ester lyase [Deltaproteobacteria bacterium]|nr:MAG: CoA ester lyase [Deltaproteobacteria bacterium]
MPRLRRAVHFVPGGNEKMLAKSLDLEADSLVLDLEDAVVPERKESAREAVTGWLRDADFGRRERVVRMNPLDSPWGARDLEATMAAPPDAYLVPKVRSRDDLLELDRLLTGLEARHGHPRGEVALLVLGTETPEGVLNLRDLPACPRVDALTWGAEDLSAAIGARRNRDERGGFLDVFRYCRIMTLLSAAAAGVQALDTVYVDIRNLEGLKRECSEAARMGFTGKLTIHPSQIDVVNEAFTPSAEEVAESRELLEAFEENRRAGRMAFAFRGQMVDAPHLERARNTLERARQAGIPV